MHESAPKNPRSRPDSPPRLALRFGLWMVFAMALFQSVTVTVAWWTGELAQPGVWEWLWIGALPLLVGVYLRYFSVLGCREDRCGR